MPAQSAGCLKSVVCPQAGRLKGYENVLATSGPSDVDEMAGIKRAQMHPARMFVSHSIVYLTVL
jgi:hypothetical protein